VLDSEHCEEPLLAVAGVLESQDLQDATFQVLHLLRHALLEGIAQRPFEPVGVDLPYVDPVLLGSLWGRLLGLLLFNISGLFGLLVGL